MIDKLEYLLALARERHFGRAAAACGVTQPTLSSGIKQLEETLGVLLVSRGSRFHGLTAEGYRTLEWARRIVADARAMRADLRGTPARLQGRLRLGVVPSALPAVAELTTPYRTLHPEVTFGVLSRTSDEILGLLDDLQIEAGLTYLDGGRRPDATGCCRCTASATAWRSPQPPRPASAIRSAGRRWGRCRCAC